MHGRQLTPADMYTFISWLAAQYLYSKDHLDRDGGDTFGGVDEAWIKEHNGPLRQPSEDAQKELETVLSQRESTGNIEEMREDLQEVCTRISEKLDSADDQQKKLILDALQVEMTVTGQKVNLGLELGVAPEVPRLTTTGRTSA